VSWTGPNNVVRVGSIPFLPRANETRRAYVNWPDQMLLPTSAWQYSAQDRDLRAAEPGETFDERSFPAIF
jgi:hypothetical protein